MAILPYLGPKEQQLYKQFHHDEPWDSPHNKKLIAKVPKIYASVLPSKAKPGRTYYQVIVGKGTPFDPQAIVKGNGVSLGTIASRDGTANTILVAEGAEPVIWTKPEDMRTHPQKPLRKIGGLFEDRFHAVFCDGSVHALSRKIERENLRRLTLYRDGKQLKPYQDLPSGVIEGVQEKVLGLQPQVAPFPRQYRYASGYGY